MKKSSSIFILFLALGVFGIITTEMGIIGVLPQVADRFHISASKAGWLVSIFAFIVAVSGPFLTLLASGINRKVILLLAVLMFAVSNAVYAYTAHFSVMLAFRIIPALCHPVFFSVALAAAARLVPAGQSGKAVTKVFSGITAGFAFGVPFTSYLADRLSLEAAFLFGAIISLIAFTGILLFLPSMPVTEKYLSEVSSASFANRLCGSISLPSPVSLRPCFLSTAILRSTSDGCPIWSASC